MMEHTHMSSGISAGPLWPLDEFYRRRGQAVPGFTVIQPEEIPEPQRSLLVHDRDMTRTLEQFHQGQIHLRVLSSHRDIQGYWRESVLELDGNLRPVELGAICIHLDLFPESSRIEILEEHRPLGAILNGSGLHYISRPSAYFRVQCDTFIQNALGLTKPSSLYGRQNTLRDVKGGILAEIIELLPPTPSI